MGAVYWQARRGARGNLHFFRACQNSLEFLFVAGHIRQIVKRNVIVGVVFQQLVVHLGVVGDAAHQEVVIGFEIVDQNLVVLVGRRAADDCGGHLAARAFDIHDLARVGADDRAAVQVIESLAGGRANAFRTPFCLGQGFPFIRLAFSGDVQSRSRLP